jgi:hypothetical protein
MAGVVAGGTDVAVGADDALSSRAAGLLVAVARWATSEGVEVPDGSAADSAAAGRPGSDDIASVSSAAPADASRENAPAPRMLVTPSRSRAAKAWV